MILIYLIKCNSCLFFTAYLYSYTIIYTVYCTVHIMCLCYILYTVPSWSFKQTNKIHILIIGVEGVV